MNGCCGRSALLLLIRSKQTLPALRFYAAQFIKEKRTDHSDELQSAQGFSNLNLNRGTLTMNSMKKRFSIATVVFLFTATAFATQPGNNGNGNGGCGQGQQTNGCGTAGGAGGNGGNGGNGGAGGNGTGVGIGLGVGIGYSNSESKSSSNSVSGSYSSGGDAKATGGSGGTANSSNSNAVSGYGGSSYGQGSGNSTSVNFEGSTYKEAAQTAYAAPVYIQPFEDCRIYVSLGGSSRDGSASGGIPLGNSAACLRKINKAQMLATNKEFPGTYVKEDFLRADCSVEGMEQTGVCKALAQQK